MAFHRLGKTLIFIVAIDSLFNDNTVRSLWSGRTVFFWEGVGVLPYQEIWDKADILRRNQGNIMPLVYFYRIL